MVSSLQDIDIDPDEADKLEATLHFFAWFFSMCPQQCVPVIDGWMCRLWLLLGTYLPERNLMKNMSWQRKWL